jgi:hypothetical protein
MDSGYDYGYGHGLTHGHTGNGYGLLRLQIKRDWRTRASRYQRVKDNFSRPITIVAVTRCSTQHMQTSLAITTLFKTIISCRRRAIQDAVLYDSRQ